MNNEEYEQWKKDYPHEAAGLHPKHRAFIDFLLDEQKRLRKFKAASWKRGFGHGQAVAGFDSLKALEAIKAEREARLEDNARFTEEIIALEDELARLKANGCSTV